MESTTCRRSNRYHDIRKRPWTYMLICRQCHMLMDLMQPVLPRDDKHVPF